MDPVWWRPSVALVGSGELGLTDPLDCHCYLVATEHSAALIDTGAGRTSDQLAALVRRALAARGLTERELRAILVTHAHADHAGGVADLATEFGLTAYCSAGECELIASGDRTALGLEAATRSGTYPPDYRFRPWRGVTPVAHGDSLMWDDLVCTALLTPGHTAGSVSWLCRAAGARPDLFTGDTVFAGGEVSLLNLPGSTAEAYRATLPELAATDHEGLFPGHGLPVLAGGPTHVRLAADWMRTSVIPNRARPRGPRPTEDSR